MAETGINIKVADTVLGSPPSVNANTMIFFPSSNVEAFEPKAVYSEQDAEKVWSDSHAKNFAKKLAHAFYNPCVGVNTAGVLLWLCPYKSEDEDFSVDNVVDAVRKTVVNSFDQRPRTLVFYLEDGELHLGSSQKAVDAIITLRSEGFMTIGLSQIPDGAVFNSLSEITNRYGVEDGSGDYAYDPFFGFCPFYDGEPATRVAGLLAFINVGMSIGDMSLPPLGYDFNLPDDLALKFSQLSDADIRSLSVNQLIFPRTRPPRNGLWWNDGSTLNDPQNALSTLEAARTLCSVVDDLRLFFTNYINTRVPVAANGDIDPTYKQVVLDNARAKVITPYIESGDISDARIELVAKNNNMVSTRTWEVKVSILPAPTLRWIDGFVFYVNSL